MYEFLQDLNLDDRDGLGSFVPDSSHVEMTLSTSLLRFLNFSDFDVTIEETAAEMSSHAAATRVSSALRIRG